MAKRQKAFRKPPYFKLNVLDFLSSPAVLRMTSEQRGWYLMLLLRAWDSSRCCHLINDPEAIEICAGIHIMRDGSLDPEELERFRTTGRIVLDQFETTEDGKFLYNARLLDEYEDLLAFRNRKARAGRQGGLKKASNSQSSQEDTGLAKASSAVAKASSARQTETIDIDIDKDIDIKVKPSARKSAQPDSRFQSFVELLSKYWEYKNPGIKFLFAASDGKAVNRLLKDNPSLDAETFRKCLHHRARSDVVHTESPKAWLPHIMLYAGGPVDRYGKPAETQMHSEAQIGTRREPTETPEQIAASVGMTVEELQAYTESHRRAQ